MPSPVRRVAIVKLQKAVVEGLVKVQIAIYTSPQELPQHVQLLPLLLS